MPSLTSGRPIFVDGSRLATRYGKPVPTRSATMQCHGSLPPWDSGGAKGCAGAWPYRIASSTLPIAIALNRGYPLRNETGALPERRIRPLGRSNETRSMTSASSSRASREKVLTDWPARSKVRTTIPSASFSLLQCWNRSPSNMAGSSKRRAGYDPGKLQLWSMCAVQSTVVALGERRWAT